jgi:hypothetical protein
MRNQMMGWAPPGGAAPSWKMGGGMGVYSPELMAMLQQRLAGMQGGMGQQPVPGAMFGGGGMGQRPMPGGPFGGVQAYPNAPAMPANPGAFTPYRPPVAAPTPAPPRTAPLRPQPMPVRPPVAAPVAPAAPAEEPLGRRLLSRGFWASR